jgi:hypothetical protein
LQGGRKLVTLRDAGTQSDLRRRKPRCIGGIARPARVSQDAGLADCLKGRDLGDRCTHVGRDLCLRERAAVDSQVVDTARKFKAGEAGPAPHGDVQR